MGIKITNLNKRFKSTLALNDVSIQVEEGIFGLLGHNGAGKTTLMRILATLLKYDEGNVEIFGYDLMKEADHIRKLLGYLPQKFNFFPNINVWEAMNYFAELKDLPKGHKREEEIATCLEQVALMEHRKKKFKELSGGMKQRLGIAQALLGYPKLLIVDEPTVGLDPNERISFRNLLNKFSKGRVVLLSTHIVPDIASTCEQLAILHMGKVFFQGSIKELLLEVQGKVWVVDVQTDQLEELTERVKVISIVRKSTAIEVRFLAESLLDGYRDMKSVPPTLEDAYVYKHLLST